MKILEINNVGYSVQTGNLLQKKELTILKDISMQIYEGEIFGIAGETGSGKTTLAKIISGIIAPTSGNVKLNLNGSRKLQILFQNNGEIINPYRKAADIIDEALMLYEPGEIITRRRSLFNMLNLDPSIENKKGAELSGGEQQRVALARLLAVRPSLLILDEPFSAQDPESQRSLVGLFKQLNSSMKITMIIIAHNINLLKKICSRAAVIEKGELTGYGETEKILNDVKDGA
jgi:peptide/nickel transport system ATP-binding protein